MDFDTRGRRGASAQCKMVRRRVSSSNKLREELQHWRGCFDLVAYAICGYLVKHPA